jgi:hypothetical protein
LEHALLYNKIKETCSAKEKDQVSEPIQGDLCNASPQTKKQLDLFPAGPECYKLSSFIIRVGRIHMGYKELSNPLMDYRKAGLVLIEQGISETLCSLDPDLITSDILDKVEVFFHYLDRYVIDDIGFRYFKADSVQDETGDGTEKRAAIFIGPEFGTVSRPDLVQAAREAEEADFDVLIPCAFNFDAHSSEFDKLGRIQVLKARINADLHMADDLKNTGKGNLFVIFGEPDIDILDADNGQIQVKVNGVDVFHPNTGEVRSDGPEGIACWFIDTDYNEEAFFVRHAYFLGASDPYKSLKTTLKADIDADAWATLNSDTSRPFDRPGSGHIAVKVINHLGDEVMKVFRV